MKKQKNKLFLIGPMGAGKTSVGRYLAKQLKFDFYDTDEQIEKKTGVNLHWVFDLEGMSGYRQRELKVIDELSSLNDVVVSTGGGCVESLEVRDILRERGVVVYMEVSLETQLARLKRDKKRPILQGENPQEVLIKLWEEREPYYEEIADYTVVTDHRSVRDVCKDILSWLKGV
jgi:shikimate kinase